MIEEEPKTKAPTVLSAHDTSKYLDAFKSAWNDLKPYGPPPLLTFTVLVILAVCVFVVFRGEPWAVAIGGLAVVALIVWHLRLSAAEGHRERMRRFDVEEQRGINKQMKGRRRAALPHQGSLNLPDPSYPKKDSTGGAGQ